MGTFNVTVEVAAGPDGPFEAMEALVDTGATFSLVPASILRRLGIEPTHRRRFMIADGSSVERDAGWGLFRIDGLESPSLVIFGDEGAWPLLGAFTLEAFGLGVDPVQQELIPVDGYLVSIRTDNGS